MPNKNIFLKYISIKHVAVTPAEYADVKVKIRWHKKTV